MQDPLPLIPFPGPVDATVSIPGSKSYTNRALLIAAMADGRSVLHGALFSDPCKTGAYGCGLPTLSYSPPRRCYPHRWRHTISGSSRAGSLWHRAGACR